MSTLPLRTAARKRAFRIALAQRGMSGADFAARLGVTRQAVNAAANGTSPSKRLLRAIDRFIASTAKRYGAAV